MAQVSWEEWVLSRVHNPKLPNTLGLFTLSFNYFLGSVPKTNGTEFYNCRRHDSVLSVYGHGDSSSTVASVVGIALLFLTVTYMWYVSAERPPPPALFVSVT